MSDPCFDVFNASAVSSQTGLKRKREGDDQVGDASDSNPTKAVALSPDAQPTDTGLQLPDRDFENESEPFGCYQKQEHSIETTEGCIHERVYPPNYSPESAEHIPAPVAPAKTYPFTLDKFQRISVDCLEKNESVLVAAHTSAGKTVVAEYAIAMSLRDGQRVVYTSPIKALSNQKYRELNEEFGDVGLMTGDVSINPSASCLVMTTEILRNMLYRGSEVMREVKWVIFDEIHYMRDRERGVVWEETMILLHHKVRFVFLSATIPNAREFAMWVSKLHNQPCNVVHTDQRPTPLQHYVFPAGGEGLHLVVDDKGDFREDNFQKACASLGSDTKAVLAKDSGRQRSGLKRNAGSSSGSSDIFKLVRMILERRYDPVIIFSFSKRECEANALQLSKLDFTDDDEKKMIQQIFSNAIETLSAEDQNLPQVVNIIPLLRRGIGIHHGGLLPIVKEVIEILFQESLLKVLCSTETFSMGLNMPAKTVVFTACRKFDGSEFRLVSPGEYVQMAGRAGRRGLDARGLVIVMMEEKLEPQDAKQILMGQADPLNSSFHLGYNMLLNLLLVEGADPEYVIERSFHQFQASRASPKLNERLQQIIAERDSLASALTNEADMNEYHHLRSRIAVLTEKMLQVRNSPQFLLPFLNPGRLVQINDPSHGTEFGWGAVVNFKKHTPNGKRDKKPAQTVFLVDILVKCALINDDTPKAPVKPFDASQGSNFSARIIQVVLSSITKISSVRVFLPKQLTGKESGVSVIRAVDEVIRRFPGGIPELDPVDDMKISDEAMAKVIRLIESAEVQLKQHPLHEAAVSGDAEMKKQWDIFIKKRQLDQDIETLTSEVVQLSKSSMFSSNLKSMKRVLRRLGFITAENVVDVKGRVACCISTADELLATELIFSGVLNELSNEHLVALLSCLVYTEKGDENITLNEGLAGPLRTLRDTAKQIAEVSNQSKLAIDIKDYVASFKPDMMPLVQAWCKGAKFADICKMSPNIFEGSIIRCMRRLEELMRQLSSAAKLIGNADLEQRFEQGIISIKRDIVFAGSLYL